MKRQCFSFDFGQAKKKTTKIVKSNNYTNNLCEKQFSFFEKHDFSDICIISSDEIKFHSHKIVLASGSDFFMTMFEGDIKESNPNEVKIQEFNGETFKPILAFMYTGNIELQSETIKDILGAANFLQIKPLIEECYNFMGEELDARNCLDIIMFADEHGLTELYQKASNLAYKHFEEISNKIEFLELNENQVSSIISDENISAPPPSQENVFLTLIKWIEHDKQTREIFALKIFSHVRYWLLSVNFIIQNRNKLPKQIECIEMICTWLEWHLSPNNSGLKSKEISKLHSSNEKLVFIGNGKKQTYNPELNTWMCETLTGFPLTFDNIVETNNKLIIQTDSSLKCYDLNTHELSDLPGLRIPRALFGLAVYRNELYVIGGRSIRTLSWMRLVDKFNFSSSAWQSVTPMTKALIEPKVAVASRLLYVKGDGNDIECLNPESIEWSTINCPYKSFSCCGINVLNEKLYFVGGRTQDNFSRNEFITCVPSSRNWEQNYMRLALSKPKCISWRNRLIVCGGYDDTNTLLNLIQEYNPDTKKWRTLAPLDQIDNNYAILNTQNENDKIIE